MEEKPGCNLSVNINPLPTTLVLGTIVIGLAAAHASVHLLRNRFGVPHGDQTMFGLLRFFDMGSEANLPTYVSALNLLLAGGLAALIARHESRFHRKHNWHWWGLAIGFLLMSFDEAAMIHEGLVGVVMTEYFGYGEGITYYTWYLPYIPFVLIIGLLYLPFFRRMPLQYSLRFSLAATVFLGGAIGFEMLESYVVSGGLSRKSVVQLFEETGEMLGVVLAIHALLHYVADKNVDLLIGFRQQYNPGDAVQAEHGDNRFYS
jgi:hypothetical protein